MGLLYTIPFGQCFLKTLAEAIQKGSFSEPSGDFLLTPHAVQIWLPTNRSVLGLQEIFAVTSGQCPITLPTLYSFGDLESKNPYAIKAIADLPTAISAMERLSLVMDLLPRSLSSQKRIRLATYLTELHDECIIAAVPLEKLESLFEGDRLHNAPQHIIDAANHLTILTHALPKALAEKGLVTAAERSNQALSLTAEHFYRYPTEMPIVTAGTTGTVPATRSLMKSVMGLPKGAVILPGLEPMETNKITRVQTMLTHPQHTVQDVCSFLGVASANVQVLTGIPNDNEIRRQDLIHLFAPFPLPKAILDDRPRLILCDSLAEEARIITAIVREQLLTTDHEIAVVTPNQGLMDRLYAAFEQHGITPNLSAGRPLVGTPVGTFLKALLAFLKAPSRLTFIHLAKHPLCQKKNRHGHLTATRSFEAILRKKQLPWYGGDDTADHPLQSFIQDLKGYLETRKSCMTFKDFLDWFVEAAAHLSNDAVFEQSDGESAWAFAKILGAFPPAIHNAYEDAFLLLLPMAAPVHSPLGLGSRVRILGTLEARLNTAETVICATLNEGNWPKIPEADPYLSNGLRESLGLPSPKRQQGLAAHDLCSSFYAKNLFFTRAKSENGEVMLPSRLWTRLEMYYGLCEEDTYKAVANAHGASDAIPIAPPIPIPPKASRPKTYFASHIEQLMKDPYAFYTSRILRLTHLDPLSESLSAKDKGQIFHDILDQYVRQINTGSMATLEALLTFAEPFFIEDKAGDAEEALQTGIRQTFWWHRFQRVASWWHDKLDHEKAELRRTEVEGSTTFEIQGASFTLKSRADRIEMPIDLAETTLRLIDYKTGQLPTIKSIQNGTSPQLLVEAIIAHHQGFGHVFVNQGHFACEYWRLSGGEPAGECRVTVLTDDDRAEQEAALLHVLQIFDDPAVPYLSNPAFADDRYFSREEEWNN